MKHQLKCILESKAPYLLDSYRSIKNRRMFRKRFSDLHNRVRHQLYGSGEIKVLSGPFEGMSYIDEIVWGPVTPKWLGSYEIELNDVIDSIIDRNYEEIIDVGCAEGYYAVGLAYRIRTAEIYAYDTDFISRRQIQRLSEINNVQSRVHVSSYCSSEELQRHGSKCGLIICDVEGFERLLLDPERCPVLSKIDILVEVHEESWTPSTLDLLKQRFSPTHALAEFQAKDRKEWVDSMKDNSAILLNPELFAEAVDEHRSNGREWLWMKAVESGSDR